MVLGVVAEVVAAVEDPAGHVGVLVQPAAHGEDGDPRPGTFGFSQDGPGNGGITLAVEGEGDTCPVAGAVVDLHGLPGDAVRGGGVRAGGGGPPLRCRAGEWLRRCAGGVRVRAAGGEGGREGGPGSCAQGAAAVHRSVGGVHALNIKGVMSGK